MFVRVLSITNYKHIVKFSAKQQKTEPKSHNRSEEKTGAIQNLFYDIKRLIPEKPIGPDLKKAFS